MKELRASVEDVSQRNMRYNLIKGSGSKAATAAEQSIITSAALFGIDEARRAAKHDKSNLDLVHLVNEEETDLRVIAVWGTSANLGQTSIIRTAYENPDIKTNFPCRAWVRVMHPFNPKVFVQSLVEQFHAAVGVNALLETEKTAQKLADEFNGFVNKKRYLIVINGLSTIEEWDQVKKCFPNNKIGCRIIVSTTQVEVASLCAGQESIASELKKLSADQNIYAFHKKVFRETIDLDKQYPELVEQATHILRKCNSLPLAIVTIGGFLANQPKTALEWRKLNEHISAELEMNPVLGTIRTVLLRSYDGLPYHLKSCFLYMPIFPEDQRVRRGRLVRRWTAEGYSREVRGKSVEEIADGYFMELIGRSMILPSQGLMHSTKGIDSCQVHDLMREIGISKSIEENLVFTLEQGCSSNNQATMRHLSINSSWKGDKREFESIVDLSRVRSLTIFGEYKSFFISNKMTLLRVLDMEGTIGLCDDPLKHIGKLLHLRYLSLRGCFNIHHLPDSLGNLRELQTLDVRGTSIIKLPKSIINLQKLNHVYAGRIPVNENVLSDGFFEEVPKVMQNRSCLLPVLIGISCLGFCAPHIFSDGDNRYRVCANFCTFIHMAVMDLDLHGVQIPRGMKKLKALRTMGAVNIAQRGNVIMEDIKGLTQLRKLGVTGVNKENRQELCSAIVGLSLLESLSIRSEGEPGLSGCLDAKFSFPESLQSLKMYGNLVKLPEWIEGLKNLVKLKLRSSKLLDAEAAMEVLGNLPNLASLHLLELNQVGDLSSVEFEGEATPKLELLQFNSSVSNPKVGLFSGLPSLPSLKEFMLDEYKYEEDFMEELQGELAKNQNGPALKRV